MLRRMIVKEWKEKSGLVVFALIGLLLFSLASFRYSKDQESLDTLVSTILLIFLPAFSLLLGASGFASEFQDGAWAYFFSRPVKKWRVWLSKYVSLLAVLYAVVLLFDLLIRFHPALRSASKTFNFSLLGDTSQGMFVYLLPLLFFTTAFSLSIVYDRPYGVVFLAGLIWLALPMALTTVIGALPFLGALRSAASAIPIVFVLLPISFVLASLITFNKADFSQPRRRVWTFTISAAASFLILVVAISLYALAVWIPRDERYIYNLQSRADGLYFATDKGFFKFDAADGRTRKIADNPSWWGGMSLGGDNIAFSTYYRGGERHGFAELRIMKINGRDEKPLVGTWDETSPLYGSYIRPICISHQGDRVAFFTHHSRKAESRELWVINSDGSELKGYDLGIPDVEYCRGIWFDHSAQSLFLICTIKIRPGSGSGRAGAMFLRMNLESGQAEMIADMIRKPYFLYMQQGAGMASNAGRIAYLQHDETLSRDVLVVMNPESREKRQVFSEEPVAGFRWNAAGDKIAFLASPSRLGLYSAADQKVSIMKELKSYDLRWPSQALGWTRDDRLILRKSEGDGSYICLLDAGLKEQKAIRLPFSTFYPARMWSAGNYVVVEDTERHQLWGVDLTTGKWHKVY